MKSQNLITHDFRTAPWTKTAPLTVSDPTQPSLRGSQRGVFAALKDRQFAILNAPTGWGKSLVIIFLVVYKLLRHPRLRFIISVPQTVIARGFVNKDWKLRIDRKLVDWIVGHNLCHTQATDTIAHLIQFLRGHHTLLGNRILLCTHATLAQAYKRLKRQHQLGLFKNVVLWIDEGHHVMNAQVTGSEATINNSLGALVKYCMAHGNHVGLATATYQRGDMRHILSDAVQAKFTRVSIPYDVYFNEAKPVETFEFNIIAGDVLKAIASIFRKKRPTILYLAKRNSYYAGRCKYQEVRQIVRRLGKQLKQPVRRDGVLIRVGDLKILDLVTEKNRDACKAYLDDNGAVDIIIALDTCKEGFDWPEAERCIILGERHSVPEMIQMIGRLFRAAKGKTHAEVYQVLPAVVPDSHRFKEQRNDILTVIFSAMLLEDVFLPIAFTDAQPIKRGKRDRTDRLISAIPNTDNAQALMRDFQVAVQARGYDYDKSWRLAPAILKKHGIAKADWQFIWKRLWIRFALQTRKVRGLRTDVSFEILKRTNLSDGLLTLASDLCGAMTFQEFRRVIGRGTKTLTEHVQDAKRLAKERRTVHSQKWLIAHGYKGLCHAKCNHPEAFIGIKWDKRGKSPAEHLQAAMSLVKKYGAVPNPMWLREHGQSALEVAMRTHPRVFAHLKQERSREKTLAKCVLDAKQLAKTHGAVPHQGWLMRHGWDQLVYIKRRYPDAFAHIPQERKRKSLAERVDEAKQLAKEHGGLPSTQWLIDHGHGSLVTMRQACRAAFSHIKLKHPRGKSLAQSIQEAKHLAKENKGLPSTRWLLAHGHTQIVSARYRHREAFANIPRQRLR
jgi:superfamily II DNA or RNA helicase